MEKNITHDSKKSSGVSVGMISLITFFTVLLLVSFSILIVASARSDERLTQLTADATIEQYAADAQAEQMLQDLYFICQSNSYDTLPDALTGTAYTVIDDENFDGIVLEYKVRMEGNKYYHIKIGVPKDEPDSLVRLSWQLVADIPQ